MAEVNDARPSAHSRPPEGLRSVFKKYQRAKLDTLDGANEELLDFKRPLSRQHHPYVTCDSPYNEAELSNLYATFLGHPMTAPTSSPKRYIHEHFPGKALVSICLSCLVLHSRISFIPSPPCILSVYSHQHEDQTLQGEQDFKLFHL